MTAGGIARRYAKALAAVAAEAGALEPVGRDLRAMAHVLKEHRGATAFFANPAVPLTDKKRVLAALCSQVGVGRLTADFLGLVLEKRRLPQLEAMALAYEELIDERLNRVKATVTSATPLPDPVFQRLRARLEAVTGKEVYVTSRLDPAILGGLVTQVGGTIYDGSLKSQLRRMREQLLKG